MRFPRRSTLVPLLLACVFWVTISVGFPDRPFAETQAAQSTPKPPSQLLPSQVWVSSIPLGLALKVYDKKGGLISEGVTPAIVDLNPSTYRIGVVAPNPSKSQPPVFGVVTDRPKGKKDADIIALKTKGGGLGIFLMLPFLVEKVSVSPVKLVALVQPAEKSLDDLAVLFPTGDNFTFDEAAVRTIIKERGVSDVEAPKAISLLRRGGKLFLRGRTKGGFVIDVCDPAGPRIAETIVHY